MTSPPPTSVIVPTHNRKASLRDTLESLARQTCSPDRFDVIVVDDGSTDGTEEITSTRYPFVLRYVRQKNQGDASARNTGVRRSRADVLVFLDDDIVVAPDYLACLIRAHERGRDRIVVGTERLWLKDGNPLHEVEEAAASPGIACDEELAELPFVDVCSNNMSIRRDAYVSIGMMHDLEFSGSSMWCDVDFAYRAYRRGFEFYRSANAVCWHRDYVAQSLENSKRRMRTAAYRAVRLFQKHPELLPHVPMFDDKTPIRWSEDPPHLVVRKLARHVTSSDPALAILEWTADVLKRRYRSERLLAHVSRWILGGYIFRGYREGLRDFGPIEDAELELISSK